MTGSEPRVTRREEEVLVALGERLTNAEIAARLYLSERTVESHVSSLLRKFAAANRLELSDIARAQASASRRSGGSALPAPIELLANPDGYCGREDERRRLRALWDAAAAGVLRVGVISGEAGIGKSRLVAEVAAEAHAAGARVLFGANFEDVERPFAPLAQAIAADAASLSDVDLRTRVGNAAEALARVVPELADRLGVASDALVFDAASARADAYAGIHSYFQRAAADQSLVLVVEDAHWASSTTLGALHYLASVGAHTRLLVLITTRDGAPDLHEALKVFLADLQRVPGVERVALSGLDPEAVATLLAFLGARMDPALTAAETGGNPLFVQEVASSGDGAAGGSLASLLTRRNALVDQPTSEVLDAGAVIGAEFDAQVIAAALGRDVVEVIEALDRGEAAGLVVGTTGRATQYGFTHALFRNARYDAIPNAKRLALHGRVATSLAARADDDRVIPELAHHACVAAPLGGASDAVHYASRAAQLAEAALAFDEAATMYRRALDVVDLIDPPDSQLRLALSIRLGEVVQGAGQGGFEEILIEAAHQARRLNDPHALAEVGWAMVKYGGPRHPERDAEFVSITKEALRELGPAPTAARARTLAAASEDLCFTDPTQASVLAHEALAIARRVGDPTTLGHVLLSFRVAADTPGDPQARHPTADELIAVGQQTDQPTFKMLGLFHRAVSFRGEGNLKAANEAIDDAIALRGDRTLPPTYMAALVMFESTRHILDGDLAQAEVVANDVWALETPGFTPMNWYGPALLVIRHSQDRLGELLPLVEPAVDQPGIGEIYRAALSLSYAHVGRVDDARALLREFADTNFGGVARNFAWLASLYAFAETAELVGDVDAARQLLELLGPFTGLVADLPQTVVGTIDLAIAQCALTGGAVALAEEAAARAVDASRLRGTPILLGRELVRLAAARKASRDEYEALVSEARELAARHGAALIERELAFYDL